MLAYGHMASNNFKEGGKHIRELRNRRLSVQRAKITPTYIACNPFINWSTIEGQYGGDYTTTSNCTSRFIAEFI
jgi:hypothetical protein